MLHIIQSPGGARLWKKTKLATAFYTCIYIKLDVQRHPIHLQYKHAETTRLSLSH